MALKSLDLVHTEISALFDSMVGTELQANYARPVLSEELEGRSPIFSLHYDGSQYQFHSANNNEGTHYWRGTLLINRIGHGATNAETLALQITTKLVQVARDNISGTHYSHLAIAAERISPAFTIIEGVPYRTVEIPFISKGYGNG